ncbi:MAG TPA: M48 family metalloprotease [Candidatus Bathyarchaeia archaeon]|nr:M48 family metalloprotease [Candidatus Bathyarchaeia archaeon]
MIEHFPRLFIILAWVFLGPVTAHGFAGLLSPLMIILTLFSLILAVSFKRSFQGRSITLLCVLALMFYQSLQLIVIGLHIELMHPDPVSEGIRHFFSIFFDINLGLAITGVVAAFAVATYVEFGKSRMPLTRLFPQYQFLEAPPYLQRIVKKLAVTAGVQMPHVSLLDSGIPWAFITRSNQGFVLAVSVGLLESLGPAEVEACLAHEISHLKNKDFALRFFATMAKVGLFARPLSYLIEPAVYRSREHLADSTASKLVGGSNALLSALSKIREAHYEVATPPASVGMACLFHSSKQRWFGVFDKQPSLDARIKALREGTT